MQASQWSGWPISELKAPDIASLRDYFLEDRSSETVRKYLSLLSDMYTHARQEWALPVVNPVSDVKKPLSAKARDRRLAPMEEEMLLTAADQKSNPRFGAIVRLGLYTAMRQGEILDLRWGHINFSKRVALLPETKNGDMRGVPLSSKALATIKSPELQQTGKLFSYTKSGFRVVWRRMIKQLGMADLRFHDLRLEATSRFFEQVLNPMGVSSITGHKTMSSLQRYTHLRAVDLVEKLG